VNFQYQKDLSPAALARLLPPFLERAELPGPVDPAWLVRVVSSLRERAKTLVELAEAARFYLVETVEMTPKAAGQLRPDVAPALDDLIARLDAAHAWEASTIEAAFHETIARHAMALGKLAQPVRAAVTGSTASPGIYEVLEVLGRERSLARLRAARARITSVSEPSAP